MRALLLATLVVGTACGARQASCPSDAKLDALIARVDQIGARLDAMQGAARPAARPGPPEPDPALTYAVPVDGSPSWGLPSAEITIVMAFDFACPYCFRASSTIDDLKQIYGDKLRVVYKQFVVHPQVATEAAHAACAAAKQGKYVEMHRAIYASAWEMASGSPHLKDIAQLDDDHLGKTAASIGLDAARLKTDAASSECAQMITTDEQQMTTFGVRGTPAFFINGRFLSGAQPIDAFRKIIDEELKKADAAIAAGTPAADYYATFVVGRGKKSL